MLIAWLGGCAAAPGTRAAPAAAAERDLLLRRFEALNAALLDSTLRTPASNEQGQLAWQVSFQMTALVTMLEATRDTAYAAQLVRLADAVAQARDDRQGRVDEIRHHVLKGWGARKYSMGQRTVWAVHSGLIAAPMAEFAAAVRREPAWAARYGGAADRLLGVAGEAMSTHRSEYSSGPGPDEGRLLWFRESLPFNQQSIVGRAWLAIDGARGTDPADRGRLPALARFLRHHLRLRPDSTWIWSYWVPLNDPVTDLEDISHAGHSADFLVRCVEAGVEFTPADLRALERTFLRNVIQPGDSLAATVGGEPPRQAPTTAVLLWGRLARHSPKVRDALLRLYRSGSFRVESRHVELLGLAYLIAALPADSR
jgi:hypothetical protein